MAGDTPVLQPLGDGGEDRAPSTPHVEHAFVAAQMKRVEDVVPGLKLVACGGVEKAGRVGQEECAVDSQHPCQMASLTPPSDDRGDRASSTDRRKGHQRVRRVIAVVAPSLHRGNILVIGYWFHLHLAAANFREILPCRSLSVMTAFTRREMFRLAIALPATGIFTRFNLLVAAERKKVKITDIKAMQINRIAGNCLIKIETDAGIVGYGEAGMTGPMARARIATMKPLLIGKDPLAIEVHFQNMTSLMHTYMASIPTISGIDIALWDIAGKITELPISTLLGGPFRESIRMYSHGRMNMLDQASCKAFADRVKDARRV
jgi:mandelate racemase/muconate lactonizing enzyme-like protein